MIKRLPILAVVMGLTLSVLAQQNQNLRDRDPDLEASKKLASELERSNFHSGPWYLWSRIRIADAGFSEGSYMPTGDTASALSISIEAPQRFYFVPRKKTIYSVEFVPGYSFFHEGEAENQWNYRLRGDAHFLLNHLYLDLYASRADELRAHVADINRLATAKEDEIGVAGEVKYSSRTSTIFTLRARDTEYPDDRYQPDPGNEHIPVEVLDRRENNARVAFVHKTFPRTSLFVAAEGSEYDFRNKASFTSRRTYAGGGFEWKGDRTTFTVEAGPTQLDYDDPLIRDYDGITARLRLSRENGPWRTYLNGDRDLGFSLFVDNPYFVSTSGDFGVDYSSSRKLTLHGRVSYEQDDFEVPVNGLIRQDDIFYSSVGFTYAISSVRLGADVGWYERDSTSYGDEESGIRYVLRLSLNP